MSGLTEKEWIKELERIAKQAKKGDAGWTVKEWASKLGTSTALALRALHAVKSEGRLVRGSRPFERIDGKPCLLPVYSIAPKRK